MDFKIIYKDPMLRLSAFGAQDGWFGVYQVDLKKSGESLVMVNCLQWKSHWLVTLKA